MYLLKILFYRNSTDLIDWVATYGNQIETNVKMKIPHIYMLKI